MDLTPFAQMCLIFGLFLIQKQASLEKESMFGQFKLVVFWKSYFQAGQKVYE